MVWAKLKFSEDRQSKISTDAKKWAFEQINHDLIFFFFFLGGGGGEGSSMSSRRKRGENKERERSKQNKQRRQFFFLFFEREREEQRRQHLFSFSDEYTSFTIVYYLGKVLKMALFLQFLFCQFIIWFSLLVSCLFCLVVVYVKIVDELPIKTLNDFVSKSPLMFINFWSTVLTRL